MSAAPDFQVVRTTRPLPPATLAGFVLAVLAVAIIAFVTYRAASTQAAAAAAVTQTMNAIQRLEELMSTVKDAETGQRGYLLTGEERYLEPYNIARAALPDEVRAATDAVSGDAQREQVGLLRQLADEKMAELAETVGLRRAGQPEEARRLVLTDRGKASMDRFRAILTTTENQERDLLLGRQKDWDDARVLSIKVIWGGWVLLLALIASAGFMTSRDFERREADNWVRSSQAELGVRLQGDQRDTILADRVLSFLAARTGAEVGAIYVIDDDGLLRRAAAYALPASVSAEPMRAGDTLVGQAAKENRLLHVTNVPAGYLPVESAIGRATPRELLVAPATVDGVVYAVIELGFLRPRRCARAGAARARVGVARRRRPLGTRSHAARGAARGDAAPGRGAAGPAGRAARHQRGARGAGARAARSRRRGSRRSRRSSSRPTRSSRSRRRRLERQKDAARRLAQAALAREGRRARAREPVQVRVPRQHVPRAAHAAQLVAHPRQAARRQQATAT